MSPAAVALLQGLILICLLARNGVALAAADGGCRKRVVMEEGVRWDEEERCHPVVRRNCRAAYETVFKRQDLEECSEAFKKVCKIRYKAVAVREPVEVCRQPVSRDCRRKGRVVCSVVYQSVCETSHKVNQVEDDRPVCAVEKERRCTNRGCFNVPKRVCKVAKDPARRTAAAPATKCRSVPRTVCGPEACPLVKSREVCHRSVRAAVQKVPEEKCHMKPWRKCRTVTKVVPRLEPRERCVEEPSEACVTARVNPRRVLRPKVVLWCPEGGGGGQVDDVGAVEPEKHGKGQEAWLLLVKSSGESAIAVVRGFGDGGQQKARAKITCQAPSKAPNDPAERSLAFACRGRLYSCSMDVCNLYDKDLDRWQEAFKLKYKRLRDNAGGWNLVTKSGDILFFGGEGKNPVTIFDHKSGEVRDFVDLPEVVREAAFGPSYTQVTADNLNSTHVILVGGNDGRSSPASGIRAAFVLDLESRRWTRASDSGNRHISAKCGLFLDGDGRRKLLVIGRVEDESEVYDVESDAWSPAGALSGLTSIQPSTMSLVPHAGTLLLFGGSHWVPAGDGLKKEEPAAARAFRGSGRIFSLVDGGWAAREEAFRGVETFLAADGIKVSPSSVRCG